jgi:hypothetical protein
MNGGEAWAAVGPAQETAALARKDDLPAHERLCGERAKTDDESWIDQRKFLFEPPTAFFYFVGVRAFVEAPFAALLVLKVLDGIGDIDCTTVKPGLLQCPIEDTPSRPNEGMAFSVFHITRLFADHHQLCICRALAEDSLGGMSKKRAALTARCIISELS